MDKSNLETYLPSLENWCQQQSQLKKLWIYGSRAKGTASEESDIDIAFEIYLLKN